MALEFNLRTNAVNICQNERKSFDTLFTLEKTLPRLENNVPLDVYLLLDKSQSMSWQNKMDLLKQSVLCLVDQLLPGQRLCIITFNATSELLIPITTVTSDTTSIKNTINQIFPSGATNISDALTTMKKEMIRTKLVDRIPVAMLFSDGLPQNGIKKYISNFVVELQNDIRFPIYTFAIGDDHDPTFLNNISKESLGGVFHHIKVCSEIPEFVGGCFGGLASSIATDFQITFTLLPGASVSYLIQDSQKSHFKPCNYYSGSLNNVNTFNPETGKIDKITINLGLIMAEESKNISLSIMVKKLEQFKDRIQFPETDLELFYHNIYTCSISYRPIETNGTIGDLIVNSKSFKISRSIEPTVLSKDHIIDEQLLRFLNGLAASDMGIIKPNELIFKKSKEIYNRLEHSCAQCKEYFSSIEQFTYGLNTDPSTSCSLAMERCNSGYSSSKSKFTTSAQITSANHYTENNNSKQDENDWIHTNQGHFI